MNTWYVNRLNNQQHRILWKMDSLDSISLRWIESRVYESIMLRIMKNAHPPKVTRGAVEENSILIVKIVTIWLKK